jgi:hypothetical protein
MSIAELLDQPPADNDRSVLGWLVQVLTLWNNGRNAEVTDRRHDIIIAVEAATHVRVGCLPIAPPRQDTRQYVEYLIRWALNLLWDTSLLPVELAYGCGNVVWEANRWLGQSS